MRAFLVAALAATLALTSAASDVDGSIMGCIFAHEACVSSPGAGSENCGVDYEHCLEEVFLATEGGGWSDLKRRALEVNNDLISERREAKKTKHKGKHNGGGDPGSEPPTGTTPGQCVEPDCAPGYPPVYPPLT